MGSEPVYATDKGLEELTERRGDELIAYADLAERLRIFVDTHPEFDVPIERLAVWLAREDDLED